MRHVATQAEIEGSGGERETTNNRMEMMAVIQGLEKLKRACRVELMTDSSYVANGLSKWMAGWKKNGWKRRQGQALKPLKNADLWQRLDELASQHAITPVHVKGHSGHPENERCDQLAVAACHQVKDG